MAEFLRRYDSIEVAHDPFPFSGSTASFQALSMGVPVVTWPWERMAGRWTAAMLHALDLGELIAGSRDDYIGAAISVAANAASRRRRRPEIRTRLAGAQLCDGAAWTKHIGRLYRAVWRRHCAATATCLLLATMGAAFGLECGPASSPVERIICETPALSSADTRVASLYGEALRSASDPDPIRREQQRWITGMRNICAEVKCLLGAYASRQLALGGGERVRDNFGHPSLVIKSARHGGAGRHLFVDALGTVTAETVEGPDRIPAHTFVTGEGAEIVIAEEGNMPAEAAADLGPYVNSDKFLRLAGTVVVADDGHLHFDLSEGVVVHFPHAETSSAAVTELDGTWQSNLNGARGPGTCSATGMLTVYSGGRTRERDCMNGLPDMKAGRCNAEIAALPIKMSASGDSYIETFQAEAGSVKTDLLSTTWTVVGHNEHRLTAATALFPLEGLPDAVKQKFRMLERNVGKLVMYRCDS